MSALATVLADADGWDHMDGWGAGWMWLWGSLMMAGFVLLVVWMIRTTDGTRGRPPAEPTDRAREILAERYAKGEISTTEYRERIDQLK